MERERDSDEEAYANLTDELNDPPETYLGGERPPLDWFDTEAVALAEKFAKQHNLPWPPQVGDFDRYYEMIHRRRYFCPRCQGAVTMFQKICTVCGVDMSDL